MSEAGWIDLGVVRYAHAWEIQKHIHAKRLAGDIPDIFLAVRHPHVLTAGSCSGRPDRWENLRVPRGDLEARGVDLVEADRGGDITWHGPGQLVGYPIVHLESYGRDVGRYVRMIEALVLGVLRPYGIEAERLKGFPGVWVTRGPHPEKICAVGFRIRKWVSMHGFALNLSGPLAGFDWILPCGLEGKGVTSIERQTKETPLEDDVLRHLQTSFSHVFERALRPMTLDEIDLPDHLRQHLTSTACPTPPRSSS